MSGISLRDWKETFVLCPSRREGWLHLASGLAAVLALVCSGVPPLLKGVLLCLIPGLAWWSWRRRVQVAVLRLGNRRLLLQGQGGAEWLHQVPLGSMGTRWFISIEVYPFHQRRWYRRRWVTVHADQLTATDFHRLGVWLLHHQARGR